MAVSTRRPHAAHSPARSRWCSPSSTWPAIRSVTTAPATARKHWSRPLSKAGEIGRDECPRARRRAPPLVWEPSPRSSRALGFLRVLVVAAVLGTTFLGNAFQSANSLSNVLFELLAAGALSAVLVPTFVELLDRGRPPRRRGGGRRGARCRPRRPGGGHRRRRGRRRPLLARALTAAYPTSVAAEQRELVTYLLRFFVPQVLLYAAGTVATAVLYASRRFVVTAAAPIGNTVVMVACLVAFRAAAGPAPGFDLSSGERLLLAAAGTGGVVAFVGSAAGGLRRVRVPAAAPAAPARPAGAARCSGIRGGASCCTPAPASCSAPPSSPGPASRAASSPTRWAGCSSSPRTACSPSPSTPRSSPSWCGELRVGRSGRVRGVGALVARAHGAAAAPGLGGDDGPGRAGHAGRVVRRARAVRAPSSWRRRWPPSASASSPTAPSCCWPGPRTPWATAAPRADRHRVGGCRCGRHGDGRGRDRRDGPGGGPGPRAQRRLPVRWRRCSGRHLTRRLGASIAPAGAGRIAGMAAAVGSGGMGAQRRAARRGLRPGGAPPG